MIARSNTFNFVNSRGAANFNQHLGGGQSACDLRNEVDVGYDTDTIAIFEIDKSFTDYLLCQICFSKRPFPCLNKSLIPCRNEPRSERMRLL